VAVKQSKRAKDLPRINQTEHAKNGVV